MGNETNKNKQAYTEKQTKKNKQRKTNTEKQTRQLHRTQLTQACLSCVNMSYQIIFAIQHTECLLLKTFLQRTSLITRCRMKSYYTILYPKIYLAYFYASFIVQTKTQHEY